MRNLSVTSRLLGWNDFDILVSICVRHAAVKRMAIESKFVVFKKDDKSCLDALAPPYEHGRVADGPVLG